LSSIQTLEFGVPEPVYMMIAEVAPLPGVGSIVLWRMVRLLAAWPTWMPSVWGSLPQT
jgi:hypothetical protein